MRISNFNSNFAFPIALARPQPKDKRTFAVKRSQQMELLYNFIDRTKPKCIVFWTRAFATAYYPRPFGFDCKPFKYIGKLIFHPLPFVNVRTMLAYSQWIAHKYRIGCSSDWAMPSNRIPFTCVWSVEWLCLCVCNSPIFASICINVKRACEYIGPSCCLHDKVTYSKHKLYFRFCHLEESKNKIAFMLT